MKQYQCPCNTATKCKMDEPCLGCEEYAQWCLQEGIEQDDGGEL